MNTVLQLADGVFTVGQSIGDVHGWIAKITNASMFSIQPEQGKGRKVTIFLSRERGLPPSMQPGMAIACGGLTFKGVYNGNSPQGAYTQNQFDAQFVGSPTSQPGSPAGAAPGNGDRDAQIERQSARRDAVSLVFGLLDKSDLTKDGWSAGVMSLVELFYHAMLKITGTDALPAQPAQPAKPEQPAHKTLTPGQTKFRKELTTIFGELGVEAEAAVGTAGKAIYKGDWNGWRELTDTELDGLMVMIRDNKQGDDVPPDTLDDIPFD